MLAGASAHDEHAGGGHGAEPDGDGAHVITLVPAWGSYVNIHDFTTPPGARRIGTVGLPLPGVELRLAEDGEIFARGAMLMSGQVPRAPLYIPIAVTLVAAIGNRREMLGTGSRSTALVHSRPSPVKSHNRWRAADPLGISAAATCRLATDRERHRSRLNGISAGGRE